MCPLRFSRRAMAAACRLIGWLGVVAGVLVAKGMPAVADVAASAVAPQASAVGRSDDFFTQKVVPFVKQHCLECHSGDNPRASFSFKGLKPDFSEPEFAGRWAEVMDQINLGAMPPEEKPRPAADDVFAVAEWIGSGIRRAQEESRMKGGQVLLRRLNRDEYANTVVDLLALDPGLADTIRARLPADGTADGFDRIAAALYLDQTLMDSYLDVGSFIAGKAIFDKPVATQKLVWEPQKWINFGQDKHVQADISKEILVPAGLKPGEVRTDGIVAWHAGYVGGQASDPPTDPEHFYGTGNGPRPNLTKLVTTDGFYRIRFPAGASRGKRGVPIRLKLSYAKGSPIATEHVIDEIQGSIDKPEMHEAVMFLRAPAGDQHAGLEWTWNAGKSLMWDPAYHEKYWRLIRAMTAVGRAGADAAAKAPLEEERAAAFRAMVEHKDPIGVEIPGNGIATAPQIFLGPFEIEGPIQEWPPRSHVALGIGEEDAESDGTIRRIFVKFLPRAYRRPVEPAEVEAFVTKILAAKREFGLSHHETLRHGLVALLVSPGFLLIQEPQLESKARPLDDHELAARLSYFLWNSLPDAELAKAAADGRLLDPAVRRQQVERMLADPKIGRFVTSFAGQWLDVRQYGSVQPSNEYRYRKGSPYDDLLEAASKEEPLAFFRHVLDENRPITDFLDSDYLVINKRLARHYDIPDVTGDEFRKVAIPEGVERGGVLGMVGLLTLLADGNRTLPVRRAAWVREKLLHDPSPPPPPGAGEIQPNTAGEQLTVRQRLERHRNEPTCASCHAGLDGYGLALENYDAIGAWRTHQNGEGQRINQPIDPSGTLKSGRSFATLAEYKQALLAERDLFGRAFVHTMLTYALTRPVGVIDDEAIDAIFEKLKQDDFRIRSVVHGIVDSPLFLTK